MVLAKTNEALARLRSDEAGVCQDSDQLIGYRGVCVRAEGANRVYKFFFSLRVEKGQKAGVGAETIFAKAPYRGLAYLVAG